MPAAYTHEAFGNEVFDRAYPRIQELIGREKDLFTIGLQGPDLFFFYHPLKKSQIHQIGTNFHLTSGREFFAALLARLNISDPLYEAKLAYICGALCHFTLDASCHAYINEYAVTHHVSHTDIEGELDRYTLALNGLDPNAAFLAANIHASSRSAEVIASLYNNVDQKIVTDSLKDFILFHRIMRCRTDLKRNTLYGIMKLIGKYESLRGHIIPKHGEPVFKEADQELTRKRKEAVPIAVRLITAVCSGSDDSGEEILNRDFNGVEE